MIKHYIPVEESVLKELIEASKNWLTDLVHDQRWENADQPTTIEAIKSADDALPGPDYIRETTSLFWNCNCLGTIKDPYCYINIREPYDEPTVCSICGASSDHHPDSFLGDVIDMLVFINQQKECL